MEAPKPIEPRRGEQRYRCAIAVLLRRRGSDQDLLTSEVSFRGAFVRTSDPPPVNSLVRLVFTLPPDNAKVTVSAHVIRVALRNEGQDQYPGFVAKFVALDGPVKERWEALITWLRAEHAEAIRTTVTFARQSYLRLFQQKAPTADDVWLKPDSVEALLELIEREVPSGNLTIPAGPTPRAPGLNVAVRIVHPITEEVVVLRGVTRRRAEDAPPSAHQTVALMPLSDDEGAAVRDLAASVVVIEDYDVELYEEAELEP